MVVTFDFKPGDRVNGKYVVEDRIGSGFESEVYLVREIETGVERAAKCFFPQRNKQGVSSKRFAQRMHTLRRCEMLARYHGQETIFHNGRHVEVVFSEYVSGVMLSKYVSARRPKRLDAYTATHLLYAMAKGLEPVHASGEYHGDLHTENFIVERVGLKFDLKLLDMYHWKDSKRSNIQDDVIDLIGIYYDLIGGSTTYAKQPQFVKDISCGRKRQLILKKFNTAGKLRRYLEKLSF